MEPHPRSRVVENRMAAGALVALALACVHCRAPQDTATTSAATRAAPHPCTASAVQAVAPPGVTIGPISNLNEQLPPVPTGALQVPAAGSTPAYCLVTGTVVTNPRTGKTANFGVALPHLWNGKFLFSGCGGLCGVVFQTLPAAQSGGGYPTDALAKGYAITATDDGHVANPRGYVFDGSWALQAPGVPDEDAVADFYARAVHVVTRASRALVGGWYGSRPTRSYFIGCSEGGREGMVEATRFPEDFDGYVVGAPPLDLPGQVLAGRASRVLLDSPDAYVPAELLARVDQAVYASCDRRDGVKDGLIQNPAACAFDPASLRCEPGDTSDCLSPAQLHTLNAWLTPALDEQGRVASFGFAISDLSSWRAPGTNLWMWAESAGPPLDPVSPRPWGDRKDEQPPAWSLFDEALKYFVFLDPEHDSNRRSPIGASGVVDEGALALLEARARAGRGDRPQALDPFLASDRKLILYHGYSDGFVSPFGTVRWFQDWARRAGGFAALGEQARLFMVPGMYHCNLGPGPNFFDALGALERWVEHGQAPASIVATKYEDDDRTRGVERTMPLCPFPTQARYRGGGDLHDAASWSCAPNEELLEVADTGRRAGLLSPRRTVQPAQVGRR